MRWIAVALLAACGGGTSPKPLPAWQKGLPPSSVMGSWRGLQPARGIIHLHSVYSHDACDGMPRDPLPDGVPNEPCLDDLRTALCTDQIDFAALTDHGDTMADEEFPTLYNMRGSDQPVMDASTGDQIASRITCDDGHVVTVRVGGENQVMPVMLHHHVPGDVTQRHATYGGYDAPTMQAMRDAGGLAWIAHTEQHPIADLRMLLPDGIEVYNLHANIDPTIRSTYLGLPGADAIQSAVLFVDTSNGHPEPDLALLSFLSVNQPAVTAWNQVLADGRHVPATAGTDAHENVLPVIAADGERGDSYRRTMRWFANIVEVTDPQDPIAVEAAVGAGRMFAAFELMGTPSGFDVHANAPDGTIHELGDTTPVGSTLVVDVPTVLDLDPSLPAPEIHATVLFIDSTGASVATTGDGPELDVPLTAAGAYRVEITIVPHQLGPYLHDLGTAYADQELPWIYASPIYVQ